MTKFHQVLGVLILLLAFPLAAQKASVTPGVLYVKISENSQNRAKSFDFNQIPGLIQKETLRKTKPNQRQEPSVLDGLYKVYVTSDTDILALCESLNLTEGVIYAEPVYQEQLLFIPNDPAIANGNQNYLEVIKAYDAWSVTRGSSDIIIGISDTGLDLNHTDLKNKLYINKKEPVNGIDDDENGLIDDYQGWDFGDNDNMPDGDETKHGSGVAGLAGAQTNNNYGIAGVGYLSSLSSLKVYNTPTKLINTGYESILYAADNGYDVLNLSWGSADAFSKANQDIISYAVTEKDVVIIAAAGNTNADLDFYPASYEHVLSVAASNLDDTKAGFSTYSHKVDLTAPGSGIYTLANNEGFYSDNGTSYSSPMVAGTAALVRHHFPTLKAVQIAERIRVTSDPVYHVGSNSTYLGKLGYGRLNVYRALTDQNVKSVRLQNLTYHNLKGLAAYPDDTVVVEFNAYNFLEPIENLKITASSASPYVTVISKTLQVGIMNTMSSSAVLEIKIKLAHSTPAFVEIPILFNISDGDYEDFQYLEITSAPDYATINNGNIEYTVTGNGNLGFYGDNFFNGTGLRWNGTLYAGRLGFGISNQQQISDNYPTYFLSGVKSKDFATKEYMHFHYANPVDYEISSTFTDSVNSSPVNVLVSQQIYTNQDKSFLIHEYDVYNQSFDAQNLSIGYYVDWDIPPFNYKNKASYSKQLGMMIACDVDSTRFGALYNYFDAHPAYNALDLEARNGNAQDLSEEFTDALKLQLQTKTLYDRAGALGAGNNVSVVIAHDSLTLAGKQSTKTAFVMLFGSSLEELAQAKNDADALYKKLISVSAKAIFSTCKGATETLAPDGENEYVYFSDAIGLNEIGRGKSLSLKINGDSSFYFAKIEGVQHGEISRVDYQLISRVADFTISADTLYLEKNNNTVQFTDRSFFAKTWEWDFGNGSKASIKNPSVYYGQTGTYPVSLKITSTKGCVDTRTRNLLVTTRPEAPQISDYLICSGGSALLSATNTDSIAVYSDALIKKPSAIGKVLEIANIFQDTTVYVSNILGPFESIRKPVKIRIDKIVATYTILPDTIRAENAALLKCTTSNFSDLKWYIDRKLSGTDPVYSLTANKSSYELSLVNTNGSGCIDSLTAILQFATSPVPDLFFEQPCFETSLTLRPGNGQFFAFYEDEMRTNLLHKGKSLRLNAVTAPKTVFIAGIDKILPSDVIAAEIVPIKPEFEIIATPDTLILAERKTAQFTAAGDQLTGTKWYLNGDFSETVNNPIFFFSTPNTYQIVLEGKDNKGCINRDTLNYTVYNERPKIILSASESQISCFPNPTLESVQISAPFPIHKIELIDMSGQLITISNRWKNNNLSLAGLPPGIYMIQIHHAAGIDQKRIILLSEN